MKNYEFPYFFFIFYFFQFPRLFQTFPDYSVSVATVFYVQNMVIKKLSCYCHKQYLLEGALHLASVFYLLLPPSPPPPLFPVTRLNIGFPELKFPKAICSPQTTTSQPVNISLVQFLAC